MSSKALLRKAKAASLPKTTKPKQSKPLDGEEDSSDSDFNESMLAQEESESEEENDENESEEESVDVTEEALEKMMVLLGDYQDPALDELEEAVEGDEEEESGSEEESGEDEILYEDLEEEDNDITPVEKTTVNDKEALLRVLATFKSETTTFFDTLTLTYPKDLVIPDAENDLDRELEFYKQSLWAAQTASSLFAQASLPFTRPTDYFAEMVKSDDHMSRIRQNLLDEQAGFKASDEARKLRDAKKFGKKVQVERLKEREKDKKEVGKRLDSLKHKRKGADGGNMTTEDFDIALEDAISGNPAKRPRTSYPSERGSGGRGGRGGARGGISRRGRDAKFGNPTASRRPKENNDKIDGDNGGGRPSRGGRGMARGGRGGGGRGGSSRSDGGKRLGKSRRN